MKTRSQPRPRKKGNPDLRRSCKSPNLEIPSIVEAFTKDPITVWYQEDAKSNDKKWSEDLLNT